MKIAIFGLGYVGFTAACCLSSEGHKITGVDVSDAKIQDINAGTPPFEEPGLLDLMRKGARVGQLSATKDAGLALKNAELAIVCVGTPSGPDGAHDMRYIVEVSRQIAIGIREHRKQRLTVAYRSTMRPGSTRNLVAPIFRGLLGNDWEEQVELVYNPEFLREAQAINDYFHPPKIVIGTRNGEPSGIMATLYSNLDAPTFVTRYEEAEITKFVDNSWHAVKVAFANEIGRIGQRLSLDAATVHRIFAADIKLNISAHYTRPGGAFGGSCLPKDVRAIQYLAADLGANVPLLDSLLRSNDAHKNYHFERVSKILPDRANILLAGLAFKAGTDDLRESPNVDLARKLIQVGHGIRIFDPSLEPQKLRGQNLGYAYSSLSLIDQLLVSREEAEAGSWDLVIVCNATGEQLDLAGRRVYATHSIS